MKSNVQTFAARNVRKLLGLRCVGGERANAHNSFYQTHTHTHIHKMALCVLVAFGRPSARDKDDDDDDDEADDAVVSQ